MKDWFGKTQQARESLINVALVKRIFPLYEERTLHILHSLSLFLTAPSCTSDIILLGIRITDAGLQLAAE